MQKTSISAQDSWIISTGIQNCTVHRER